MRLRLTAPISAQKYPTELSRRIVRLTQMQRPPLPLIDRMKRNWTMRLRLALAAMPLCLFLNACGHNSTPVRAELPAPPAERLVCAKEPRVPDTITDATTATFIAALAASGQDCRAQLAWVRDWIAKLQSAPAK